MWFKRVASAVLCASSIAACAPTFREGFAALVPAVPEPPGTAADTVLRLVLMRAVSGDTGVPDFNLLPDSRKVVLLLSDSSVTPRILPDTQSVRFVLLTLEQIRTFAGRYGHFVYLSVGLLRLDGDSAQAGASTQWMSSPRNPAQVYLSGGGCNWQFRRRAGEWLFEKSMGCIIS